MRLRIFCAVAGALIALPFQIVQLALLLDRDPGGLASWPALGAANLILLVGVAALAADFPLARRSGRAALVGIGIPMLLPGPTVIDGVARIFDPGTNYVLLIPFLVLNLLLLLMLGFAEAGIYLLATRPNPQA